MSGETTRRGRPVRTATFLGHHSCSWFNSGKISIQRFAPSIFKFNVHGCSSALPQSHCFHVLLPELSPVITFARVRCAESATRAQRRYNLEQGKRVSAPGHSKCISEHRSNDICIQAPSTVAFFVSRQPLSTTCQPSLSHPTSTGHVI